jgi:vitamin B12 transporter
LIALFAGLVAPATGEPPPAEVITVVGSPLDVQLPATTTIDRTEIENSRRTDLSEVLDLSPGINVRNGGRGEPRADMRGFDQRATLITLDGVPLYEPYNGVINLDLFPLDMLESVETVRGPSSSLFGPNGMAGTIKLNTLEPSERLAASTTTTWQEDRFFDTRGSVAGGHNGVFGAAAGRYLTQPWFPLSSDFEDRPESRRRWEDGGRRFNSDREEGSFFARLAYQGNALSARAVVLGSEEEFGIPISTTGFIPQYRRNDGQSLLHTHGWVESPITDAITLGGALFYSGYSTKEIEYDGPDFRNQLFSTKADSDEIGTIARLTAEIGEHDTLLVGTLWRGASADISGGGQPEPVRPDVDTVTLGVENVYRFTDRIALVTGLSYDLQTGGGRSTDWELCPQSGFTVDLERFGTVSAAVSRKIRFPTLRELFDPLQGNPDLNAESALTYELGHHIQWALAYVDLALFRSEVHDLIEMPGGGEAEPAQNLSDTVQQGVELATGVHPWEPVHLDVNYTFLNTDVHDPGVPVDSSEIQHRPAHRFNGILHLNLPLDLRLRIEGSYTSDQLDRFGSDVKVDDYALFNVALSRTFTRYLEVFTGVRSALDVDYEDKLGSPQPGRWVFAGLRGTY